MSDMALTRRGFLLTSAACALAAGVPFPARTPTDYVYKTYKIGTIVDADGRVAALLGQTIRQTKARVTADALRQMFPSEPERTDGTGLAVLLAE